MRPGFGRDYDGGFLVDVSHRPAAMDTLEQFAAGEPEAFEMLFRQYQGEVYEVDRPPGPQSRRGGGIDGRDILADPSQSQAVRFAAAVRSMGEAHRYPCRGRSPEIERLRRMDAAGPRRSGAFRSRHAGAGRGPQPDCASLPRSSGQASIGGEPGVDRGVLVPGDCGIAGHLAERREDEGRARGGATAGQTGKDGDPAMNDNDRELDLIGRQLRSAMPPVGEQELRVDLWPQDAAPLGGSASGLRLV